MYDKQSGTIFLGKSGDKKICIYPKMANRHGMICGATGTGKTITLKVLAESFSDMGVPVFLADVKGDLAGFCKPGADSEDMQARIERFGLKEEGFKYDSYPTNFWDVYADKGMPLRTTISEMGPLLLARILELNDTQTNVLAMIFKIADDNNMLLIDTKDLKAMLNYVADHAKEYAADYGSIARQSVNAIIRSLVNLESQGGEYFFGEPALDINDWLRRDSDKGPIQVLDCQKLINHPIMYATFLLWMMSELFESLPEVGDLDKPRMVFFFDEAHLLFDNAPKALMTRIEQVVKLIRSKGVGIFFVTQNPADIPDPILAQLGNKIEHALHAYTPAEQKKAKAAAQSFVVNPEFDTYETLLSLGTGEALVSVLDEKGVPTMVENTKILPPCSLMGSIDDSSRDSVIRGSGLFSRYSDYFDRDSAYEFLQRNRTLVEGEAPADQVPAEATGQGAKPKPDKNSLSYKTAKAAQSVAKTGAGTVGREVGKTVGGAIGGKFGKTLGGNIGSSIGRNFLGVFFKT
jgi:DNA helicase HerA-like ATPase